ncbi:YceI family protein [Candidatus Uhrbacteria bacterium]|nr:YceI family protein [Candidatus Uhrbacteria bacterium]
MNKPLVIGLAAILLLGAAGFGFYSFMVSPTKGPSQVAEAPSKPAVPQAQAPMEFTAPPTENMGDNPFRIDAASSKATFSIFEILRGEPKTVIGTTTNISGVFMADMDDLSQAKLGTIYINARTFSTDSSQRDNTTRRAILKTEDDANEFITFKTISIEGLPTSTATGTLLTYSITGDLTISGVTKPAVFTGSGTFNSENEFVGNASTTVKRSDFNLIVPSLAFLADVADEVPLTIEFTAKR